MNIQTAQIDNIQLFANTPCTVIDAGFVNELAASIEEQGLNVPILVKTVKKDCYEIIDGRKRWMACKQLGHKEIPIIIKEVGGEKEQLLLALVTNLQRHTLTPMEIAQSIEHLQKMGMSQREIGKSIGKSQGWVQVRHKLLELDPETLKLAGPEVPADKRLNHAKASLLVDIPKEPQIKLAKIISTNKLSVANARRLVAEKVREHNIPVANKNTSRLCLIEDIKKFSEFIKRTNEYLDNFLAIKATKFDQLFEGETLEGVEFLRQGAEEAAKSMSLLEGSLKLIYDKKESHLKDLEEKRKTEEIEIDEVGNDIQRFDAGDEINLRTASALSLLYYLGLNKEELCVKKRKKPDGSFVGNGLTSFWRRPIDHLTVLKKAKQKYTYYVAASKEGSDKMDTLNRVWESLETKFKDHGFTL